MCLARHRRRRQRHGGRAGARPRGNGPASGGRGLERHAPPQDRGLAQSQPADGLGLRRARPCAGRRAQARGGHSRRLRRCDWPGLPGGGRCARRQCRLHHVGQDSGQGCRAAHKATFVTLLGLHAARDLARQLLGQALQALDTLSPTRRQRAEPLAELARRIVTRSH